MSIDTTVIATIMGLVFVYGMAYGIKSGMLQETFGGKRDEENPGNRNFNNINFTHKG